MESRVIDNVPDRHMSEVIDTSKRQESKVEFREESVIVKKEEEQEFSGKVHNLMEVME